MKTPHPCAEILRAIADGHRIQWQNSKGDWEDQGSDYTMIEIGNGDYPPSRYRIEPDIITINGHSVPAPLRNMHPVGTTVFWPSLTSSVKAHVVDDDTGRTEFFARALARGILHPTREAAQAHADALLSFTKQP